MRRGLALSLAVDAGIWLAGAARAEPAPEAKAYFDHALGLLRTQHINSPRADWPAIETEARAAMAQAQTTQDTHAAIRLVIERLGERHSFLALPRPSAAASTTQPGAASPAEAPMPAARLLDGGIGLVTLPALGFMTDAAELGNRYRATLRQGLEQIDDGARCGWIVDLRGNGGGNMWPMLQGLDPLLGAGPFGRFLEAKGDTRWRRVAGGVFPVPGDIEETGPAFALQHADAPLAVLFGPRTGSSGEMVAIAFVGRKDVRTFGAPTAGLTTANVVTPLRDGAMLVITISKVGDRTGMSTKAQ